MQNRALDGRIAVCARPMHDRASLGHHHYAERPLRVDMRRSLSGQTRTLTTTAVATALPARITVFRGCDRRPETRLACVAIPTSWHRDPYRGRPFPRQRRDQRLPSGNLARRLNPARMV